VLPETGDEAVVLDLSSTGILIETTADLATYEQLQLHLPEVGEVVATVMWNSGQYFGCELHNPIPQAAVSAALLRSPFNQPAELPVEPGNEDTVDVAEAEAQAQDDRFPLSVRLSVILGLSLVLWALILWGAGLL
jgi:hypothetical protein